MRYWSLLIVGALTLSSVAPAQQPVAKKNEAQIAHGKYLVEDVAGCADCHSPRDQKGEFVKAQWLGGSPLFFAPTVTIPNWAAVAPPIAGLPGYAEQDVVRLLMTGHMPAGTTPRPPMPPYRFNRADAVATVKYLKSLKPVTSDAIKASMSAGQKAMETK